MGESDTSTATSGRRAPATPGSSRLGSMLVGVFFGLSLAAAGAFFCRALWGGYQRAKELDHWTETPCAIVTSEVVSIEAVPNSPLEYEPRIDYRYRAGDQLQASQRVKRVQPRSAHRERMEKIVQQFPPGSQSRCWVDPADPTAAVLLKDSKAAAYTLWFPALFIVGGLGIAISAVRPIFRAKAG